MSEVQAGSTKGYYRKPHQLRTDTLDLDGTIYKLVDFLADLTFGWGSRWVLLSQDEIIAGKRRPNGEHMPDLRSGLKEKKSLKKAVEAALALHLIEVRSTRLGTAYAIHRRYWGLLDFAPKWEVFGLIYYDPETDPIPQAPAGGLNPPTDDDSLQHDPSLGVLNPPGTDTESTSQYSPTHQPVILKQPAESRDVTSGEARDARKDTSLDTSLKDTIPKDMVPLLMKDEKEEGQEEQPNLATLRAEYATLSQQLEQLDAHKQAGQWARLYKQVQSAEERLRQAEQETSLSPTSPPEFAKQREALASNEGAAPLPAAGPATDGQQERLRAIASDLLYWKGGLKVLKQARLPKWRGSFQWQIEAKIVDLQAAYASLRAEAPKPEG